jgi:hypothetical protein
MFRFLLVAFISCAMCLAAASPSVQGQSANDRRTPPERRDSPAPAPRYTMVDGHLHFLNFVQETFGMDALFNALDHAGVTEAVVLGMPLVKTWDEGDATRPTYYLDNDSRTYWYSATDFLVAQAVLSLPTQRRARLHPFICGFNSADRNAVDHIERLLALYPGVWHAGGAATADGDAAIPEQRHRCDRKSVNIRLK